MRFLELHADNFGPLKNLHFEMQGDVFVVVGHNEAGKSSFHGALETILYGFEVSSRDKHPLAQFRSGEDLELRAKLLLDDKTTLSVRRVLMTQGKLEILDANGTALQRSNNNEALPAMQSVPRSLFQAVYSLTANDTDMQRDDVRGHIRELLLGETGLRGARPISQVRGEVESDMQALWREDSRGTPQSKDLRAKITLAKKERRAAKQTDRELREAKRELDHLGPERAADQTRLSELRGQLEQLAFHQEWRTYQLKQAAVDLVDARLADSPEPWLLEALVNPTELEQQRSKLAELLIEPTQRLERTPLALTPEQTLCIEKEAAIETVLAQVADRKDLQRSLNLAHQRLTDSTRALDEGLRRLGARSEARKTLGSFPLNTLQTDAEQWDVDLEQFDLDSQQREASAYWVLGALIGIVGVALQAFQVGPAWAGLLAIVLGFAFAIGCFLRPTQPSYDDPRPELPENSAKLLADLGLQEEQTRSPQTLSRIADQIDEGQKHLAQARGHMQAKKDARSSLDVLEQGWLGLAGELHLQVSDPEAIPNSLRQASKLAEQAQRDILQDAHERETALVKQRGLQPQWESHVHGLKFAHQLLTTAFPSMSDLGQAFDAWGEIGRKRISAEDDLARLQASPYYPTNDVEEYGVRHPVEVSTGDKDPQELRQAIEALEESTSSQSVRIGELKQLLASNRTAHLARAEETITELETQLQETLEQRDHLALLGQVLKKAEARYRKENEPDVLHKAGQYLRDISQGRYTALSYPAESDSATNEGCLQVHSIEDGLRDVAKPLSRGTQEQIYLALRLGTLDYLDEGREKLPLILDEALVHWDSERRQSLYGVLEAVAKKRQVILFTCHESFATEVQEAMGARVLRLIGHTVP